MKLLPVLYVILSLFILPLNGQHLNEIEQIVQRSIDLEELQKFYRENEIESRIPLIILNDSILPFEMKLMKFGESVKIMTKEVAFNLNLNGNDHSLLEIIRFNANSEKAFIFFHYLPERIKVKVHFKKADERWEITEYKLDYS